MHDRLVSTSSANLLAAVLMLAAVGLVIANFVFGSDTNDHLAFLAMPFFVGSCVARVRALLCKMSASMQDVFDAGKVAGRAEVGGGSVRTLR